MNKFNIFFLENDSYTCSIKEKIKSNFYIQENLNENTEIIVCRLAYYLGIDLLKNAKSLKYIVSPTTGLGHIDLEYCQINNIKVLSLKDTLDAIANIRSTSELTLFLIIGLIRNIFLAEYSWDKIGPKDRMKYRGRELSKMKVGIVGLGRIGNHLREYLESFKAKVFFYDIDIKNKYFDSNFFCESLEELIIKSDIISINADLNKTSNKLFSKKEFDLMNNKYLVNTARAEILEKKYLIEALENNSLLGYATDVYWEEQELSNYDKSLTELKRKGKNIILTPHLGGCTIDAMEATEEIIFKLLDKVLGTN